jgi:hypothetical protein
LRQELRLREFDNRVLRKIFGPKRDKATGELRKLRNEEFYVLFCSHNIVGVSKQEEKDETNGAFVMMGGGGGRWGESPEVQGNRRLAKLRV